MTQKKEPEPTKPAEQVSQAQKPTVNPKVREEIYRLLGKAPPPSDEERLMLSMTANSTAESETKKPKP